MVVNNSVRTRVRLIHPEDASRIFRHLAPVGDTSFVEVCEVDTPLNMAWCQLRDGGYGHLQSEGNTIYVVTECHGEAAARAAIHIAREIFDLDAPSITMIHPHSSQAGLAATAGR